MKSNLEPKLEALKGKLKEQIKADTAPEAIEEINGLIGDVDDAIKEHQKDQEAYSKITDLYLEAIGNQGSSKPDKDNPTEENSPKSFEECLAEAEKSQNKK